MGLFLLRTLTEGPSRRLIEQTVTTTAVLLLSRRFLRLQTYGGGTMDKTRISLRLVLSFGRGAPSSRTDERLEALSDQLLFFQAPRKELRVVCFCFSVTLSEREHWKLILAF